MTFSSRHWMLREAVRRRSGLPPSTQPSQVMDEAACSIPSVGQLPDGHLCPTPDVLPGRSSSPAAAVTLPDKTVKSAVSGVAPTKHSPPPPRPLFSPTTLLVGDSIIRHIRYVNVATRCFPGAKVHDILDKLPELLCSLSSSVKRVIVHVGTNDITRQQSELTKNDFKDLFNFLSSCGKSVFISGPIPTLARGAGRFTRILSLNTWLQSACNAYNVGFIDNFNLFWNRFSFFRRDGVHPNSRGSHILAANLQHAVQSSTRD